ncbi:MAG TPA: tryptophan 7-halogenase [Xanthomonadaceae bacterium]|nr:tryptophan 7-halogenase [Xanthomonadaceae bacterium]
MEVSQKVRVAVIGGGPAGCAAALSLARQGIDDVALVEAGRYARPRVGESLPPDARGLLQSLGVWDAFSTQGHAPCLGNCSAWGSNTLGYSDFVLQPMGPGWHLDRRRFDAWLAEEVRAAGTCVRIGTRLVAAVRHADGFVLELRDADRVTHLHARHVIDASGCHARFARMLGARRRWIDRLFFVYGYFLPPSQVAAERLTLVESVEEGWWYRAGLPEGRLCIALACEAKTLRARRLDRWRPWLDLLADSRHAAQGLAGGTFLKDRMRAMPAPTGCLNPMVGDGWLAAGDAACTFDPLLARGIHKAMEDGREAGQVVARWLRRGRIDAADGYRDLLDSRFRTMLALRDHLYAQETRWPQAPFWRARAALDSRSTD